MPGVWASEGGQGECCLTRGDRGDWRGHPACRRETALSVEGFLSALDAEKIEPAIGVAVHTRCDCDPSA